MKIFVGKLTGEILEEDLRLLFQPYGYITAVQILKDYHRGGKFMYGILEMPVKKQAVAAIKALDGEILKGLKITVHPARMGLKTRRGQGRGGGRRNSDPTESQ